MERVPVGRPDSTRLGCGFCLVDSDGKVDSNNHSPDTLTGTNTAKCCGVMLGWSHDRVSIG
jgi:hypothetical protein